MIYHIFANLSNIGDWLSAKDIQKLLHPEQIRECLCDEPFVEETINCDYLKHCNSARELAEAYFNADKVLKTLLEQVIPK